MLTSRPALMKPPHAWLACSLLGLAYVVSCGSDDDKTKVIPSDGGAGGEGAVTEPGEGGAAGEPPVVVEGGAGGAPAVTAGAGGAALGGQGGAGGEPVACFDLAGAGGQGGAAPEGEPLFWCRGVVGLYRPSTRQFTLITPPGLEAAVSGKFTATYNYYASPEDELLTPACTEGTVESTGSTLVLSAPLEGQPFNYITIPGIAVQDACGAEVPMNRTSQTEGSCLHLEFRPPSDGSEVWSAECYEGYTDDCPTTPSCADIPPPTL